MNKVIFVADAHLKDPTTAEYVDFMRFLDEMRTAPGRPDALFLLGDIFDFFVGFPEVLFARHLAILARLAELAASGVRVVYTEGNHDFLLGKLERTGFPVSFVPRHCDLNLGGPWYASHGDFADEGDWPHRLLSFAVKNPLTDFLTYLLPPWLVWHGAHLFSRSSRKYVSSKRTFDERVFDGFVSRRISEGYRGAILGHFHRAELREIDSGGRRFTLCLLGSWQADRSWMSWEAGRFTVRTFG